MRKPKALFTTLSKKAEKHAGPETPREAVSADDDYPPLGSTHVVLLMHHHLVVSPMQHHHLVVSPKFVDFMRSFFEYTGPLGFDESSIASEIHHLRHVISITHFDNRYPSRWWVDQMLQRRIQHLPARQPKLSWLAQLRCDLRALGFSQATSRLIPTLFSSQYEQPLPAVLFHALNFLSSPPADAGEYPNSLPTGQWTSTVYSTDGGATSTSIEVFNYPRQDLSQDRPAVTALQQALQEKLGPSDAPMWFHATSWNSIARILREGIRPSEGSPHLDFAASGAFYLNPCIYDCYHWLMSSRAATYAGQHAILVYRCLPTKLGGGSYAKDFGSCHPAKQWHSERAGWEELVRCAMLNEEPHLETKKGLPRWIHGPQVANAEEVRRKEKRKDNSLISPKPRMKIFDRSEPALQLAIRHDSAAEKMDKYLVGVIFFQNLQASSSGSAPSDDSSFGITFTTAAPVALPSPVMSSAASSDSFVHVAAPAQTGVGASASASAAAASAVPSRTNADEDMESSSDVDL